MSDLTSFELTLSFVGDQLVDSNTRCWVDFLDSVFWLVVHLRDVLCLLLFFRDDSVF